MRLPKWKQCLTKEQREHLKIVGIKSLNSAKSNFEMHEHWRSQNPEMEPCWTCKFIMKKLIEKGYIKK
jgi:hypothetical protein